MASEPDEPKNEAETVFMPSLTPRTPQPEAAPEGAPAAHGAEAPAPEAAPEPAGAEETVFMPSTPGRPMLPPSTSQQRPVLPPSTAQERPVLPPSTSQERPVLSPSGTAERPALGPATTEPPAAPAHPITGVPPRTDPGFEPAPVGVHGRVSIGDVLNGIYEVKRLIGRGGMAEVYEGVNINSDERVAIKVMLPALAADPKVQAMFRKEARTLTRIAHPAVVQYRVIAQEPRLNVLYIVTEFVDGVELSDVLGTIQATSSDLKALMRRLADGLRSAHDLGAVHRDMSPDNILLPESRLERAKIIDFGIAKDLDPSKATIVGDGFAGKLAYVAPEQFGDYGREIGPWTDVYSLGLVILAVASGKDVDMGTTLVEAVDKRRAGIDLSSIPDDLRPVLERMLMADPAKRIRSMDEILTLLDDRVTTFPPTETPRLPPAPSPADALAASAAASAPAKKKGGGAGLIIGGLVVLLLLGGGGAAAWYFLGHPMKLPFGGTNSTSPVKPGTTTTPTGPVVVAPSAAGLQQAVQAALPNLSCSWLDVGNTAPDGSSLSMVGAAGSPATVQYAVVDAAKDAGIKLPDASVDLTGVATADQGACSTLDALRSFRSPFGATPLATAQAAYTLTPGADGKAAGTPVITISPHNPGRDFALMRIDLNGRVSMIYASRKAFDAARANDPTVVDLGGDAYKVQNAAFDTTGWSGLLLITGNGPIDPSLLEKPPGARNVAWVDSVTQAATAGGWKADMVWYNVLGNAALLNAPKTHLHATTPGQGQPNDYHPPVYTPPPVITQPPPVHHEPQTQPRKNSFWQRVFG